MEIRIASATDRAEIQSLWQYSFFASDTVANWYFDNVYHADNTLVVESEGRIVASAQLVTHYIRLWGENLPVTVLCGIVTLPEERGKGHVTNLLKRAVNVSVSRGQLISILQPDNFTFFRRYGWENCFDAETIEGKISALLPFSKLGGVFTQSEQVNRYDKIYQSYCEGRNGYIVRSERNWRDLFQFVKMQNGRNYLLKEGGYLLYRLEPTTGTFDIIEIAYEGIEQFSMLLDFIYSHIGQVDNWRMNVAGNSIANILLSENNIVIKHNPSCMARVLNPQRVFEKLVRHMGFGYSVAIDIRDAFLPQNNVTVKNGTGSRTTAMDIKTYTRLALGYLSLEEADYLKLIDGDVNSLKGVFEKRKNYINLGATTIVKNCR